MKLPNLPFAGKKEHAEYFLALVLRHEKVSAVIFEEETGKVRVIGKKEVGFETSIEDTPQEELLETIDKAISSAEESLPENVETQKTVFGVKESWVEEAKIKKEYLSKLKKISEELGLLPIGFLTISEAIAHLLQEEEGAPVTAILVELGTKTLTVSQLRAGKVIETKSAVISDSKAAAVDTILKHFSSDILPAKIILFDGDSDYTQEFLSHSWSKTLPFLHVPQIVTLEEGFDARAVLFGAATQMGFEVLGEGHVKESRQAQKAADTSAEEKEPADEKPQEKVEEVTNIGSGEYFGFAKDIDVAKVPKKEPETAVEDIPSPVIKRQIEEIPEVLEEEVEHEPLPVEAAMGVASGKRIFGTLLKSLKKLKMPTLSLPGVKLPKGRNGLLLPLGGILLIVFSLYYLFGRSATVTLFIKQKPLEQSQTITFSSTSATSPSDNVLASQFPSVSEDGSASTPTTGQKETGNPAKGIVTIFNNNDSSKTLTAGTTLTSANDLKFTLDKDVTVASASGDVFSGTKPGTANGSVTAGTFGTEYNLPSGTKFSLSSSSSIAAKNDSAFSGGTKKEIKVVAKDDASKLLTDLPKSLEQKAQADFAKKVGSEKQALPAFASTSADKKTFDKQVGDEASQVTLTATFSFQGVVYDKKDMATLSKAIFSKSLPKDTTLDENNLQINVSDIKQKNDKTVVANVTLKSVALPNITTTDLAQKLSGKSATDAENSLESLPQVDHVDVSLFPPIPLLPKLLPRLSSHIKIVTHNE